MSQDLQIYQIYSQLRGVSISDAINAFIQLEVRSPVDGDRYFESFGVGHFQDAILNPYERFACYELLLAEMKKADRDKFNKIHKGTSYYFLAWTSFDIGDFERATFYLDAAFAEDVRKSEELGFSDPIMGAFINPGGWLMRLNPDQSGPAKRITRRLKSYIEDRLSCFALVSGVNISKNDFVDKFVVEIIKDDITYRSIVTAVYTFVFEFEDRFRLLNLRSEQGGTLEPFLIHLFKGGLIFESLLKYVGRTMGLKKEWEDKKGKLYTKSSDEFTIDEFNQNPEFVKRYGHFSIEERELSDLIKLDLGSIKNAFGVTHKLRNVTGHDLRREDFFRNSEDYKKLFEQEMAAILYIVNKEFIVGI